jgi:hypothetical protein
MAEKHPLCRPRSNGEAIQMHILIGLLIATAVIILWAQGNLFACVFLSIPTAGAMLIFAFQDRTGSPNGPVWALVCAALLAGIWAPRYWRLHQTVPSRTNGPTGS